MKHSHYRVKHFRTYKLVNLLVFCVLQAVSGAENVVGELSDDGLDFVAAFKRLVFGILAFIAPAFE